MSYTKEDINKIANGLLDFNLIAEMIERDLNIISENIMSKKDNWPQNMIQFEVFNDFARYDNMIKLQSVGEGPGFRKTPVLLKRLGGDFSTEKGPSIYTFTLGLEIYGFLSDKDSLYQILNTLAELKQGKVETIPTMGNEVNGSLIQIFNMPSFGDSFNENGMSRIEIGQQFSLTYVYQGILFNQVKLSVNGHDLDILERTLNRSRSVSAGQKNDEADIGVVNKTQAMVLSIMFVNNRSTASDILFDNIRRLASPLNEVLDITIEYPGYAPDNYRMVVVDGTITGMAGGYDVINCTFNLAPINR